MGFIVEDHLGQYRQISFCIIRLSMLQILFCLSQVILCAHAEDNHKKYPRVNKYIDKGHFS